MYKCICMYVCMYACMYVCMHACMYVCMHACMYACMHVCMYACMHVCMHVCMCTCTTVLPVRKHPIVLPHKLVSHCSWPTVDAGDVKQYWQHLAARGSPLSQLSPDQDHIPVWLWGDEAQYRKGSQDEILLLCMGSVLHPEKFSVASCFPLTICRSDSSLLSPACVSVVFLMFSLMSMPLFGCPHQLVVKEMKAGFATLHGLLHAVSQVN